MTELKKLFETHVDTTVKQQALYIIQRYLDAGYECWIVGGPVRDLLLGLSPKDIDFATNCPLEVTKTLFASVIPTGEDHGTLTIHLDGENYEVTRYRKDVDTDGRRATIEYAETIQEDVLRRDLTVNAIAFNPITDEIVDAVGGLKDFETRTLRFVGNTKDRVLEDHLRFIRLLRFKTKLKFNLCEKIIYEAKKVFDVSKLSKERIYDELGKIFKLDLTKTDKEFLIESMHDVMDFDYLFHKNVNSNQIITEIITLETLYPIVYHNGWKPEFKISSELRKLNDLLSGEINAVRFLNKIDIKKLLNKSKKNFEIVRELLRLHSFYIGSNFHESVKILETIEIANEPILITDLSIGGTELISLGLKGKDIGLYLERCLSLVYENPQRNNITYLLNYIKSNIS